jgi:hypothetical protein
MEHLVYPTDQINIFLEEYSTKCDKIRNKYFQYINQPFFTRHLEENKQIKHDYIDQWDNDFNIFKIITPTFYEYEKLHSNLIRALFDPETPEIANYHYLAIFVDLLKKKNPKILHHDFGNNYCVKLEESIKIEDKGSIDILIHDETYAIIIENKSHNAPDTNNQLAKYYKHIEGAGLKVLSVVYIPLDPNKAPSFDYDDEYKDYIPKIQNVLVILPVINSKSTDDDFVHGFLNKCLERTKGNQTATMFLEQFIRLFKYLGGNNMFLNSNKKLFEKIFETKESILIAQDIVKLYNDRQRYITILFFDSFIPKLKERKFESFKNIDDNTAFMFPILKDIYFVFHCNEYNYNLFSFGFLTPERDFSDEERKVLTDLLNDKEYSKHSYDIQQGKFENCWVVKGVDLLDFGTVQETINYFEKLLLDRYESIVEKAKEKLKQIKM